MGEETLDVVLSLGSNLGNKEQNLKSAINHLNVRVGKVSKVSDFFKSRPWGFSSKNDFINCCCLVSTKLSIIDFISITQEIEYEMGRKRKEKTGYTDRIIDIDIVFFGSQIIKSEFLTIPHQNFRKRDFVLLPLNQLSNHIDPETFISTNQFTQ